MWRHDLGEKRITGVVEGRKTEKREREQEQESSVQWIAQEKQFPQTIDLGEKKEADYHKFTSSRAQSLKF